MGAGRHSPADLDSPCQVISLFLPGVFPGSLDPPCRVSLQQLWWREGAGGAPMERFCRRGEFQCDPFGHLDSFVAFPESVKTLLQPGWFQSSRGF